MIRISGSLRFAGLSAAFDLRVHCPVVPVMRRGMRSRARGKIFWSGQAAGHWIGIRVFNSVTRAATLMRHWRKVSNWTVRQVEPLGMALRRPHMSH